MKSHQLLRIAECPADSLSVAAEKSSSCCEQQNVLLIFVRHCRHKTRGKLVFLQRKLKVQ